MKITQEIPFQITCPYHGGVCHKMVNCTSQCDLWKLKENLLDRGEIHVELKQVTSNE